jgi:hypothetical protein
LTPRISSSRIKVMASLDIAARRVPQTEGDPYYPVLRAENEALFKC